MMRRMKVLAFCLTAAALLCGAPLQGIAEDTPKKDRKAAEGKKNDKGTSNDGSFRDGVNKAFHGFKKETDKGKKNLNDLNEREKARSGK